MIVYSRRIGLLEHITLAGTPDKRFVEFERLGIAIGYGWTVYSLLLGSMIGIQVQLLFLTPDHGGLDISGEWQQCSGIAVDNVCHGVFLDACELYDVRFGERVTHSRMSATFFFLFRTASDALVIILIAALWYRRKVVHLATKLDPLLKDPSPKALRAYLKKVRTGRRKGWASAYLDEFVFFYLVEKYLSNRPGQCKELGQLFSEISIPLEVREMFKNPKGECLLLSATDDDED